MINISEHISYYEAIKSDVAVRNNINNIPNNEQIASMKNVAQHIFEPLRKTLGDKPIGISSFFRCDKLNLKVGGSLSSQHRLGEAIDIDADIYNNGITNSDIFFCIKDNLEFDQLIAEYPKHGTPLWVHVSYRSKKNRGNVLVSLTKNGKTEYIKYEKGMIC